MASIYENWNVVIHISHWLVLTSYSEDSQNINQISISYVMLHMKSLVFNYLMNMNDKILLLNNGFNNIEFIEFVALNMAQLYAASKPLESFLIKRMQNLLYKVSVCDNESKKIFIWDLLDEMLFTIHLLLQMNEMKRMRRDTITWL